MPRKLGKCLIELESRFGREVANNGQEEINQINKSLFTGMVDVGWVCENGMIKYFPGCSNIQGER